MTEGTESVKVYATEDEADALYIKRAETDAKGISLFLGLTVQRVYQLEKEGIIARTASGNYNLSDTFAAYIFYKIMGKALPPAEKQNESNGFFLQVAEETTVTEAELASLLGLTPNMVNRLTKEGVLRPVQSNGIAEHIGLEKIAALPLRSLLKEHGATEEAIQTAERKREALIAAVKTADSMIPSKTKWELFAVQDAFNAFIETIPDIMRL